MSKVPIYVGRKLLRKEDFSDACLGRFWNKVDVRSDDECWNWKASKNKKGYGSFNPGREYSQVTGSKIAHRFAFLFGSGTLDCDLLVCHSCDNPSCCNPKHLWQGTPKQNSEDMSRKGRSPKGERQGSTNLTESDVAAIRAMNATGRFSQKEIAVKFGLTQQGVHHIVTNSTWKEAA